jgi:hypothetical protein
MNESSLKEKSSIWVKCMTKITNVILLISMSVMTFNCRSSNEAKIRPGSICTIEDGEGKFGVVKVLAIDPQVTHVKIYKNKYDKRPSEVDINTLSLGSINDKDGFGIGHVPLGKKEFDNWKPVPIGYEKITKEDLEGYEIWKTEQK